MLQILDAMNLILLQIQLFQVRQCLQARELLDEIGLASDENEIGKILEPLNLNELVLGRVEFSKVDESVNSLNLTDFIVSNIQNSQID